MAFDLAGLAQATPWGAVGSALTAAASTPASSAATGGATTSGPKTINVAGFGSKAEGRATQSLTQAEPDRGTFFPSTPSDTPLGMPAWFLPAVGVVILLAVAGVLVKRK